jgi:Transposase DDE domain group 1
MKECLLDLFADRTSANTMRAHQLRLWFAAMAYVLVTARRRIGLNHAQFASATLRDAALNHLRFVVLWMSAPQFGV